MTNGPPYNPHLYTGPSFVNLQWCLTGTQNQRYHFLKIPTQARSINVEYAALISGLFGMADENCVPSTSQEFTGSIIGLPDDYPTLKIECSWSPSAGGQTNTLSGTVTSLPPLAGRSRWFLEGSVTVIEDGVIQLDKGPGDVTGTLYMGGGEEAVATRT
jgi:hypothetical protein